MTKPEIERVKLAYAAQFGEPTRRMICSHIRLTFGRTETTREAKPFEDAA
jgi:hypothetical protein